VKFGTGDFNENLSENPIFGYYGTKISGTLHKYLSAVLLLTALRNISYDIFRNSTTEQGMEPFLHGKSHGFVLLNSTCKITTLQIGRIVTFPLQPWLCEGATILLYTFFVFFMVYVTTRSVVRIEL
jgi:hypothetical protein